MSCCSRHRAGGRNKRCGGMKTMLFGMLVGLALGLLFAPKPGTETLNDISDKIIRKIPV